MLERVFRNPGTGHAAVLPGFLTHLSINGPWAACGPDCNAPRVLVLRWPDDHISLRGSSDDVHDLQRVLDAARQWANVWRLHFNPGPAKSATHASAVVLVHCTASARHHALQRIPRCSQSFMKCCKPASDLSNLLTEIGTPPLGHAFPLRWWICEMFSHERVFANVLIVGS